MANVKRFVAVVGSGLLGLVLVSTGLAQTSSPTQKPLSTSSPTVLGARSTPRPTPVPTPVDTSNLVYESESIPYITSYTTDAFLANGLTRTKVYGLNGSKRLAYQVTYANGIQTNKQLTSTIVSYEPTNQVIARGTYVAPTYSNNSYTNSAGNYVPSPTYSSGSSVNGYSPTAECNDGTSSYSQSRSGTCSHHGGVSSWY